MTPIGPIDPQEIKIVTFPFAGELDVGETIATVAVTSTVASGEDATPALVRVGDPVLAGANVLQRVQGRVDGAVYELRARAVGNGGLAHVIKVLLACAS